MSLTKEFVCDVCGKKYTGYRYTPEYVEKLIGSKCAVCITEKDTDKIEDFFRKKQNAVSLLIDIREKLMTEKKCTWEYERNHPLFESIGENYEKHITSCLNFLPRGYIPILEDPLFKFCPYCGGEIEVKE